MHSGAPDELEIVVTVFDRQVTIEVADRAHVFDMDAVRATWPPQAVGRARAAFDDGRDAGAPAPFAPARAKV